MWYEIDFKKLAVWFLPMHLRKAVLSAYVKVLVTPLMNLHYDFLQRRDKDWFTLAHNSQVCYLRDALNTQFDPVEKRIQITDGDTHPKQYIYTRGESKPRYLGKMYLWDRLSYKDGGVDFIVKVPAGLVYDEIALRNEIDKYRLATKTYKIMAV